MQVQTIENREETSLGRRQPKKEIAQQKMSRSLSSQLQVQLPQQGSRSISVHATQILQTAWKNTSLPPYIKTFVWRLIRRVLMTGERARIYSTHIGKHCYSCGQNENDAHLFFHCGFAWAVWFSSNPPLRTSLLLNEQDGAQHILASILQSSTSDDHFQLNLRACMGHRLHS